MRGGAQSSVEIPGPGVIVALNRAAAAACLQHQLASSMATDIGVGPNHPRLVANDDDRDLSHSSGEKVTSFLNLLDPTDIVPTCREDELFFAFESQGVGVPLGRKGPSLGERLVE